MTTKCNCGTDYEKDHPTQEVCEYCDPTRGYKLCDGDDYCFELFVPTKAQRDAAKSNARTGRRFTWICPNCASGIRPARA